MKGRIFQLMHTTGPGNFRGAVGVVIPNVITSIKPLIMCAAFWPAPPHLQPTTILRAVPALEIIPRVRIQAFTVATGGLRCSGTQGRNSWKRRAPRGRALRNTQAVEELQGSEHICQLSRSRSELIGQSSTLRWGRCHSRKIPKPVFICYECLACPNYFNTAISMKVS